MSQVEAEQGTSEGVVGEPGEAVQGVIERAWLVLVSEGRSIQEALGRILPGQPLPLPGCHGLGVMLQGMPQMVAELLRRPGQMAGILFTFLFPSVTWIIVEMTLNCE